MPSLITDISVIMANERYMFIHTTNNLHLSVCFILEHNVKLSTYSAVYVKLSIFDDRASYLIAAVTGVHWR